MTRPVVVHEDSCAVEGWEERALGGVTWRTLLSADRTATAGLTLGIAELAAEPHEPPAPAHRHHADEVYFVLAGQGLLRVDGVDHPVRAGSSAFIPGGSWHVLRNRGPARLRLLYALVADSFAEVDYEFESG